MPGWTETSPRPVWRSESSVHEKTFFFNHCISCSLFGKHSNPASIFVPVGLGFFAAATVFLSEDGAFAHLCMRVVAACFTSGRLTMTQLQPLKRSVSPLHPPFRIPITGVAELNGFNAVPTHPERLRPLQSAGKLLMHLLLFAIVKAAELATDITSRGSISTNSNFEHSL